MFNSPILETIIALVLVILVFSVLVTCVQEGYAAIFKSRGKMLEFAIHEMLNDKVNGNYGELLYQYPQIDLLKKKANDLPSYIDKETFAKTLIDLISSQGAPPPNMKKADTQPQAATGMSPLPNTITPFNNSAAQMSNFATGLSSMKDSYLKTLLQSFHNNATPSASRVATLASGAGGVVNTAVADLEALKKEIQDWYEKYMNRVTGWYKRKVRTNIFFASAVVTLIFNLNFLVLSKTVYINSQLRGTLVAVAEKTASDSNAIENLKNQLVKQPGALLNNVDVNTVLGTELPIGWNEANRPGTGSNTWLHSVLGWLAMILLLSLGSPFWFDILKKLVNIRNAGKAPADSKQT